MQYIFGSHQTELSTDPPGTRLKSIIMDLPANRVTLNEIRDIPGKDALLLLAASLTIIFLIPVSVPGVSTLYIGAILLIGVSRLLKGNLWVPKRLLQRELPAEKLRACLDK